MRIYHSFKKDSGFTLVELVVAVLIFSLSIASILSVLGSMNKTSSASFEEVQAIYRGKEILEDLRLDVDATTWDDAAASRLTPGTVYNLPPPPVGPDGITFDASYNVTADPSGGRWVNLTVSWD